MRTFNLRLILWLTAIFVVTAVIVHFVHDYQVHKNADAYLQRATRTKAELVRAAQEGAAIDQLRDKAEITRRHYSRYLSLRPDDLAVRIEFANFLMQISDYRSAYFQNEKILRSDLSEADAALKASVDEVREQHIQMALRQVDRVSDALFHINYLLDSSRPNDPELLDLQGRCYISQEDSREANQNAKASFEKAIAAAPDRISTYAVLAQLQRDRIKDPQAADETIANMLAANPDNPEAHLARAQFRTSDKDPAKMERSIRQTLLTESLVDSNQALQLATDQLEPIVAELAPIYAKLAPIDAQLAPIDAQLELDPTNPKLKAAKSELEAAKSGLEPAKSRLEAAKSKLDIVKLNAMLTKADCVQQLAAYQQDPKQRKESFNEAKELLKSVLAIKPDLAQIYVQLSALELMGTGDATTDEERLAAYTAAVNTVREGCEQLAKETAVDPTRTFRLRVRLAELLLGNPESAGSDEFRNTLEQLRREQPDSPFVAYLEARDLMIQQDWLAARNKLEGIRKNLQQYPDLENAVNPRLSQCYAQLGEQDLRLEIAQEEALKKATDVTARVNLAETLVSVNRLSEALAEYQEIMRLRDPTLDIQKRYIFLAIAATLRADTDERRWDQIEAMINRVEQSAPDDTWIPTMRAEIYTSQGDLPKAVLEMENAWKKNPNNFQFGNALVVLAQREGDREGDREGGREKAAQRLADLVAKYGDTADVRMARARFIAWAEKKAGLPKFAELVEDADKFSANQRRALYLQLSQICLQLGDAELSLQYGQEAIKLVPNNVSLRLFLLDVARAAGNVSAAQQLQAEIEKLAGAGPVALYASATVDLIRHEVEGADTLNDAQKKLAEVAKQRKRWGDVPQLQGVIASIQGNEQLAVEHFRQAISLGNLNTAMVQRVVGYLYNERRLNEADSLVRSLEEQRATLPLEMGRLASRINFMREDLDRALELAEDLPRESENVDDALWLGYLQVTKKEYAAAQATLQSVLEDEPENSNAWLALVRCLKEAGAVDAAKLDDARAMMEKALKEVKPEQQPFVHAECLKLLDQPEEAIKVYQEAVKANPNSLAILRPAVGTFMTSNATIPDARAILQRIVQGEVEADDNALHWARLNLAQILNGGSYSDRVRALELLNANLAEDDQSAADRQLKARVLINSPKLADRQEALQILRELDEARKPLDTDSRFILARSYMAEGRVEAYKDQMRQLINAASANNDDRAKGYVRDYVGALLELGDPQSNQEANALADRFRQRWGNDMAAALLAARVQASGLRPRIDEAFNTITSAVQDPKVQPADEQLKKEIAVSGLQTILEQVKQYQAKAELAGETPGSISAEELTVRKEIAKQLETKVEPIKAAMNQYVAELIGEDPQREIARVRVLVNEGKKHEAVELLQQHWQAARFDLLVVAFATLVQVDHELDTPDRELVEQLLGEAINRASGNPNELVPLLRLRTNRDVAWGRYTEALEGYRQIVSLADRDHESLNNLAMLLASRKEDLPAAEAAIAKAIDLAGPTTTYLDTQALVLLAGGKNAEALERLQELLRNKPDRVSAETTPQLANRWGGYEFHLALALLANGDVTKAANAWAEATKLGFTKADVFKPELDAYQQLMTAIGSTDAPPTDAKEADKKMK